MFSKPIPRGNMPTYEISHIETGWSEEYPDLLQATQAAQKIALENPGDTVQVLKNTQVVNVFKF